MTPDPLNIESIAQAFVASWAAHFENHNKALTKYFYEELAYYREQSRVTTLYPRPEPPSLFVFDREKAYDWVLAMHRRSLNTLADMQAAAVTRVPLQVDPKEFEIDSAPSGEPVADPVGEYGGNGMYYVHRDAIDLYKDGEEVTNSRGTFKMVYFPGQFGGLTAKRWKKIA